MRELYTDGQFWYRVPKEDHVENGNCILLGFEGRDICIEKNMLSQYFLSQEEVQEILKDSWSTADLQFSAAMTAMSRLFPNINRDPTQLQRLLMNIASGDRKGLSEIRTRAEKIAIEMDEGAARDAISMLPDRLVAGLASQYGRIRPTTKSTGTELSNIAVQAEKILAKVYNSGTGAPIISAQSFRPCFGDYELIFTEDVCEPMRSYFSDIWRYPIAPKANRAEREIRAVAARVEDLREKTAIGQQFPRQYERLLPYLKDGPIWLRWWTTRPEEKQGMSHEGLIYLSGQWLWLPRAWNALPSS